MENVCLKSQGPRQGRVSKLGDALKAVHEQTEIECFAKADQAQAEELCLIIAEVYCLPSIEIQIGKDKLPAELVQDVFSRIGNEHIKMVIENFRSIAYRVRAKKTYMRTALYNSVFEYEANYDNQFRAEN